MLRRARAGPTSRRAIPAHLLPKGFWRRRTPTGRPTGHRPAGHWTMPRRAARRRSASRGREPPDMLRPCRHALGKLPHETETDSRSALAGEVRNRRRLLKHSEDRLDRVLPDANAVSATSSRACCDSSASRTMTRPPSGVTFSATADQLPYDLLDADDVTADQNRGRRKSNRKSTSHVPYLCQPYRRSCGRSRSHRSVRSGASTSRIDSREVQQVVDDLRL